MVYLQAHCHSRYSINRLSGEGVLHPVIWPVERQIVKIMMPSLKRISELARRKNVNFVAVTDHNTVPPVGLEDTTLIRGEEWGQTKGHANFINITRAIDPEDSFFPKYKPEEPMDFSTASLEARKQGAFTSINHPFKRDAWQWGYESYTLANGLEIWNGEWNNENERSLKLWQALLVQGLKIWCMAGNDFHVNHLSDIGSQVLAFRNLPSKTSVIEELKKGNFSLAKNTKSDVVFLSQDLSYIIENYTAGLNLRIVSAKKSIVEKDPKEEGQIKTDPSDRFIRIELWRNDTPLSFTNPVFLSRVP